MLMLLLLLRCKVLCWLVLQSQGNTAAADHSSERLPGACKVQDAGR
jgi:hypothetical protein